MSDLNEEWKAGELEDGDYYIKTSGVIIPMYFDGHYFEGADDEDIQEILALVPSYEEFRRLQNIEENIRLKDEILLLESKLKLAKSIIFLLYVICTGFVFLYATK